MANRKLVIEVIGNAGSFENSMRRSSASAKQFEFNLGKTTRGALAGSGAFRAMGRSLAFASGGFLAFAGVSSFLRKSVDAAISAQKATSALATAQDHATVGTRVSTKETDRWALAQARFGQSSVAATTGLARLTVFAGSARRAMRGYEAALVISKATGRDMNAVTLAVGKSFTGQTTALSRYIGKIQKGTSEQVIFARIFAKFGGQARANTSASDQFSASLANTQEVVGRGILPTFNLYLIMLTKWLDKMNRTGRLQADAAQATHLFVGALKGLIGFVRTVDSVTGSFKHTMELLLALKVVSIIGGWATAFQVLGASSAFGAAGGAVGKLSGALRGLARIGILSLAFRFPALADGLSKLARMSVLLSALKTVGIIAIGVAITYEVTTKLMGQGGVDFFKNLGARLADGGIISPDKQPTLATGSRNQIEMLIRQARADAQRGASVDAITKAISAGGGLGLAPDEIASIIRIASAQAAKQGAAGGAAIESAAKAAFGQGMADALVAGSKTPVAIKVPGINISLKMQKTIFDNAIARILLRGGLGDIAQQIAALNKADGMIQARIKKTKDVTTRLNYEDQLLTNQAQIRSLRVQQTTAEATTDANAATAAANALTKRQNAFTEFIANLQLGVTKAAVTTGLTDDIAALQRLQAGIKTEIKEFGRTAALADQLFNVQQQIKTAQQQRVSAAEFKILGLDATGNALVPGKAALRKVIDNIADGLKGSSLNTSKVRSELANFRKVLTESLVPPDVRAKMQQLLAGLTADLKKATKTNQTGFRQASTEALLAGLGLSPAQVRALKIRFSEVGANGQVPGSRSPAFALAGANNQPPIVVHTSVNLDGHQVAKNVTTHQSKMRKVSRRG